MTMDADGPAIGDLILSLAGRDRGRLYYCVGLAPERLALANGKDHPLEHPKEKNRKHGKLVLRPATRTAEKLRSGGKVTNSELRKDLAWLGLAADEGGSAGGPGRELQSNGGF